MPLLIPEARTYADQAACCCSQGQKCTRVTDSHSLTSSAFLSSSGAASPAATPPAATLSRGGEGRAGGEPAGPPVAGSAAGASVSLQTSMNESGSETCRLFADEEQPKHCTALSSRRR